MENLLQQIQQIGYPLGADIRITPLNIYDVVTLSATIGENRLFTSDTMTLFTRNKKFPLAGNEVAFVNKISVQLTGTTALSLTAANMGLLTKTCLQVLVDGRERGKFPLIECLSAPIGTAFGANTIVTLAKQVGRVKRLTFPIIINSQSNVEIKIITDADYSALGTVRVNLEGLMYSKLRPFDFNPSAGKPFEQLSYTIFDTYAQQTAAATLTMFNSQDKAQNLYSKVFPLSNSETFNIENVEVAMPCSIGAAAAFQAVYGLAKEVVFKMNVNGVDVLELTGRDLVTVLFQNSTVNPFKMSDNSITVDTKDNVIDYGGFTLPVAITVPAKAQVKCTLDVPTISNISASEYINVMLKGTLQRLVQ